ncbi:MAG: DUF4139 domain-containing protein [Myxococcales bacterium]|nr:DUF4139 domain-containing protein [Myxococcales bacterium]
MFSSRMWLLSLLLSFAAFACSSGTSYVKTEAPLGRVVVYRNGIAYFERLAHVDGRVLKLSVPADKIDDFLKSLSVVDAKTREPLPVSYPTDVPTSATGFVELEIGLPHDGPHDLELSYISEAPAWKPSYRITATDDGKVKLQGWAIVDNTSGEDWTGVKIGVGSSSALSFRYDLRSVRLVQRETLQSHSLFAQAPPMGGAVFGGETASVVVTEFGDDVIARNEAAVTGMLANRDDRQFFQEEPMDFERSGAGVGRAAAARTKSSPADAFAPASTTAEQQQLMALAGRIQGSAGTVVIEGYADGKDEDKTRSSLDRANRVREQLIRQGVAPDKVVAVGNGVGHTKRGGVRIVEQKPETQVASADTTMVSPESEEPIGTSHFESESTVTVPRGTSAMVSIVQQETPGELVYLFDAESKRGNDTFPFRAVRLKNPTDSALESGPVTVYGKGKFIGEGLSEPIPSGSVAFIPFAMDRQIVVERKDDTVDSITRLLTVQRGVLSSEVQHKRVTSFTLHNRLNQDTTVYIRHTLKKGYSLVEGPENPERIGSAHLFAVTVPKNGKTDVKIAEATPVFRSIDIRTPDGFALVKAYLNGDQASGPLKEAMKELLALHVEMANVEQKIKTEHDKLDEYRARMDELHAQIVSLRLVKGGNALLRNLEGKMREISDKVSQGTIAVVNLEEQLMVARIQFQDGVAELTLEQNFAEVGPN